MQPLPTQTGTFSGKHVPKLLYSRKEAAELLSLSRSTVDMLIARGILPSRRMGHKRLIAHAALVAFSQKNMPALWGPKKDGRTARRGVSAKQMRLPFAEPKEAAKLPPAKADRADKTKAAEAS